MDEAASAGFEMRAGIGRGVRWLDRHGSVVIESGHLRLQTHGGTVIADAPLSEVTAKKTKGNSLSTTLRVGGKRYIVQPEGFVPSSNARVDIMRQTVKNLMNMKEGRELTQQFLVALHDLGMPNDGDQ